MTTCQNCGKHNSEDTNFCRFCGTKFTFQQPVPHNPYGHSSPRPYAWKTDEFQTQNEPRKTEHIQSPMSAPLAYQHYDQPASLISPGANYVVDPNYHCPRCGTTYLPIIDRRISTAGWVVFSCLLVFTVIFFWIGLLMKEDVAICPVCRAKVN